MKNPILRYRIAVAVLLMALLTVAFAYHQQSQAVAEMPIHEVAGGE